ncbi:MAG: glycosyltransferase family 2 protein [Candidatus Dormibacteria bacterium]
MTCAENVSCVIPVFNGETFLGEAIASVLAQTHPPHETIVVDDGSSDRSYATASAFGDAVRVLRRPHAGAPAARNAGITAATGDFVALLDADDLWHPEKLERQLQRFRGQPELGICLVIMENFWEAGLEDEEAAHRAAGRLRGTHTLGTVLARRQVFDTVGLLDPAHPFDDAADWFLRAAAASVATEVVPEVLASRRMHRDNSSRNSPTADALLSLIKRNLDHRRALAGED